ncbi:MAG: pyridoxamine 5'-phosphate oxidase family protein [Acidimicrobiales bacterium]
MTALSVAAPAFVEMAHRIVWCTAATVDARGRPATRVLHPIWEWDGATLNGWVATSPQSPKAEHLAATPYLSLTYWSPDQDTCTADCTTDWDAKPEARRALWDRFANAPAPLGYDPSIIPGWTSPDADSFGALRLTAWRLRVMPGTLLTAGAGELLQWRSEPA